MPTDYEKVYKDKRHSLGSPTKEFVDFFSQYTQNNADILDIGCGQGRDALFVARLGHHVVGVDISETGIHQMLEDAQAENLNIEGIVADLNEFDVVGEYDVAIIDRTLHMLKPNKRLLVLEKVSKAIRDRGYILIADEKRNLPDMMKFFAGQGIWMVEKGVKGFLFVQKKG